MIVHKLTEAGAVLAQALIRDPVVVRAIRSGDHWAIERAVEPHGLGAEEALVLLALYPPAPAAMGRN